MSRFSELSSLIAPPETAAAITVISPTAIRILKAIGRFDITGDYAKLRDTKVLYVQSPSDKLFDIAQSPGYVSDMRKTGIDITYVELPTNKGHMASHADAALWAPILGAFLKRLQ